jgi:hypothetical protein
MKTNTLMLTAGLFSMISAAAFAQTPVAQVQHDNAQIRQDTKQIHQDTREIKHDNAVIAVKKGEVVAGKQQLHAEKQESKALAHAEHQDLKQGNLAGAAQLDQARRNEQVAIKQQKQEIRHDQKVIAHHAVDKHATQVARQEDKVDRYLDTAKRDHDANKL